MRAAQRTPETRVCGVCGAEKPIAAFKRYAGRTRDDGSCLYYFCHRCKACRNDQERPKRNMGINRATGKAWKRAWPVLSEGRTYRHWSYSVFVRYKLTEAQYNDLLHTQGGRCALCRRTPEQVRDKVYPRLVVDHDHSCCSGATTCGKCVRALLCGKCNRALGVINDDPQWLAAALVYLGVATHASV